MPTSIARIEANRRNASRSTGPKTDAGKERSRRNAARHGLTGTGSVLPEAIAERTRALELSLRVEYSLADHDEVGRFLASQAALAMARLEAAPVVEWDERAEQVDRADRSWDLDRAVEAAERGDRLPRRPSIGPIGLLQTAQGCDWLIERWSGLIASIEADDTIDDDRRRLLADLLGVPPGLRQADPRLAPDRSPDDLLALAREEIEHLRSLKAEVLDPRDDRDRERARAGLAFDATPAARRLRGYEAACHRSLRWATDQLRRRQSALLPTSGTPPTSSLSWDEPAPSTAEAIAPAPPDEPTAHPPGESSRDDATRGPRHPDVPRAGASTEPTRGPAPSGRSAPVGPPSSPPGSGPGSNRRARRAALALARKRG